MEEGERPLHLSSQCLLASMHVFKSTINMCSGPHSVAGLSVWGTSIV